MTHEHPKVFEVGDRVEILGTVFEADGKSVRLAERILRGTVLFSNLGLLYYAIKVDGAEINPQLVPSENIRKLNAVDLIAERI